MRASAATAAAPEAAAPTAPSSRAGAPKVALGVVAGVAYCFALHRLIVRGDLPVVVVLLVLAPWALAAAAALARAAAVRATSRIVVAGLVSAFVGAAVVGIVLLVRDGHVGQAGVETVLYLENAAFFGWLCALFATTLAPGREPLVTRMARVVRHGDVPDALVTYARSATLAWALFFAAHVVVSSALFFGADRALWSLFVNVATWPCIAAMFLGEYAVRRVRLRGMRHDPLWAGATAFRQREGR